MSYIDYRVRQGDTIESITSQFLGSPEGWRAVARLNRLRAPFISDAQRDQYGSPVLVGTLTAQLVVGATQLTVPLPAYATNWTRGTVLYLEETPPAGLVYDALTLNADIDETTGLITFTTAVTNTYAVGTAWYLFPPPGEVTTVVLRTGDTLHIPSSAATGGGSTADAAGTRFTSLLGTDLQLDANGMLVYDANGHLATVSGADNLTQALTARMNTQLRSVTHHPEYGNAVYDYLGHNGSSYFITLVNGMVRQALLAEPRIGQIRQLTISQSGAVLRADARVEIASSSELLRLDNIVFKTT